MDSTEKKASFYKEWSRHLPLIINFIKRSAVKNIKALFKNYDEGKGIINA